jgi:hypothetical protein
MTNANDIYNLLHSWRCIKCRAVYTEPDNRQIPEIMLCNCCQHAILKDYCSKQLSGRIFQAVLATDHTITKDNIILRYLGKGNNALDELHARIAFCLYYFPPNVEDQQAGASAHGQS